MHLCQYGSGTFRLDVDKQELCRNKHNGWHGKTIFMSDHNTINLTKK